MLVNCRAEHGGGGGALVVLAPEHSEQHQYGIQDG
jgi:hypothetical protein